MKKFVVIFIIVILANAFAYIVWMEIIEYRGAKSIKIILPKSTERCTFDSTEITVNIDKDTFVYVNGIKASFESFPAFIDSIENTGDSISTILLRADKSVPMNCIVEVMNYAKSKRIKVMLSTSDE